MPLSSLSFERNQDMSVLVQSPLYNLTRPFIFATFKDWHMDFEDLEMNMLNSFISRDTYRPGTRSWYGVLSYGVTLNGCVLPLSMFTREILLATSREVSRIILSHKRKHRTLECWKFHRSIRDADEMVVIRILEDSEMPTPFVSYLCFIQHCCRGADDKIYMIKLSQTAEVIKIFLR